MVPRITLLRGCVFFIERGIKMEKEHREIIDEIYQQRRDQVFIGEQQSVPERKETEQRLKATKNKLAKYLLEHPEELHKNGGKKAK